jgi:agmatinase
MDIVEVSPPYDCADITAILANRVALEALSAIAHKKNGATYNAKRNLLDR